MTAEVPLPVVEDDQQVAVFDARNQYYKLWMWMLSQAKQASVMGDWVTWRRCLVSLYNHAQAFFSKDECEKILAELDASRVHYAAMTGNNRRSPEYQAAYAYHLELFENCLNRAERLIYDGMKRRNMLLPQSSGEAGEFSIDELLKQSDM